MSEQPTPPPEPEPEPLEPDEPQTDQALRREAAKWRRELRAAEAERDQLHEQVQRLERQHVEHLAADKLAAPDDVWRYVDSLDDLRSEDGSLDQEHVEQHLDALLEQRPHLAKRQEPAGPRHPDLHQGARHTAEEPSFGKFLKDSLHGG